jgi:electron transport complex protein RnfG
MAGGIEMKQQSRIVVVLTAIACLSGGVLALTYLASRDAVTANQMREQRRAIFEVVPNAASYAQKSQGDLVYYECLNSNGDPTGFALPAEGNGYQGVIRLMIGLSADLNTITGIEVLDQVETPGLGGRISEPAFQEQFRGLAALPVLSYVKNRKPEGPSQIQAITGATISTRSTLAIINRTLDQAQMELGMRAGDDTKEKVSNVWNREDQTR